MSDRDFAPDTPRPAGHRIRRCSDGRPRVVFTRGAQWSDEAEERFFDVLGETCNVKRAAKAAGAWPHTVYRFRQERADFAARWQATLEAGYARLPELEAQLLGLIAGGGYDGPGLSPDRADAMVWGLSMLTKEERVFRISTL